jgi:hypothetical protein
MLPGGYTQQETQHVQWEGKLAGRGCTGAHLAGVAGVEAGVVGAYAAGPAGSQGGAGHPPVAV